MKVLQALIMSICVVGFQHEGLHGSAPVATAVAADSYYSPAELETLCGFADALFKSTPESLFWQFQGAENTAKYLRPLLTPGNPMRGRLLDPGMVFEQLGHYLRVFLAGDVREKENWMVAEKVMQQPGLSPADCASASIDAMQKLLLETVRVDGEKGSLVSGNSQNRFVAKHILRADGQTPQLVFTIGDIHGGVHSLLRNLLVLFEHGHLNDEFTLAPNVQLIFLGDLTDRGLRGIETIYTILRLKNAPGNENRVHLVRGNHEAVSQNVKQGFLDELTLKYGPGKGSALWQACNNFYTTLPAALICGFYDNRRGMQHFLACHGGMSPYFDAPAFIDSSATYALLPHYSDVLGPLPLAHLFEWNDVSGHVKNESLAGRSLLDTLSGGNKVLPAFLINSQRAMKMHYRDVAKILAANRLLFTIRGHQDSHAAVKICLDGVDDPISFRGHPAFTGAGITPANFFAKGVSLMQVPSVITTTTCVEAKVMADEGLVWFLFGDNIENSRWGGLAINLTSMDTQVLATMILPQDIPGSGLHSLIEVPSVLINGAANDAITYYPSNTLAAFQRINECMKSWAPGLGGKNLTKLWEGLYSRMGGFVRYGSFVQAQARRVQDGDLRHIISWMPSPDDYSGVIKEGYGAVKQGAATQFTGEAVNSLELSDLGAYIPPVASESPQSVAAVVLDVGTGGAAVVDPPMALVADNLAPQAQVLDEEDDAAM